MKYRKLGDSGITVSEIGFGAWGIGGLTKGATSYGKTDDKESISALKRAYDEGINFFDTANNYGDGHSEELLGKVFGEIRDKVIIASKGGYLEHNGPQYFSPEDLTKSLEKTLNKLRTDYLDLYQLHSPSREFFDEMPSIVGFLSDLKKDGKIRAYGVSAKTPEDAVFFANKYSFDAIQFNFNLIDQRAIEVGLFDISKEKDVGLICRTPLCFGFLSGDYSKGYKFDPKDHRSTWSNEQRNIWANAYKAFLNVVDGCVEQTNVQIALRFCLSYDVVSTVIPGMLNEQEVVENVRASELDPLKKEEIENLEKIFKDNTFFIKS